jgi:hypothetical protein
LLFDDEVGHNRMKFKKLRERATMLRYTYIACVVKMTFIETEYVGMDQNRDQNLMRQKM